ncbi:MAG: DNA translocase FtsK [Planctomycetota bacterium]|nr:MAG: DNA translocase FtsK [Planctomycetota bacterium]
MFEERSVKLDLFALVLLGATLFTGLSLVTYDRADAISAASEGILVYPAPGETSNLCGRAGAFLADTLMRTLGVGAYYAVISLGVLTYLLLARRDITYPKLRGIGWCVSLLGIATLGGMLLPNLAPSLWRGPVIGPGGVLGVVGRTLLEMHFATVGAYILTLSVIFVGLLLCTDYFLLRVCWWCVAKPSIGVARTGRAVVLGRRTSRAESADEEYEEDEYEDEEEAEDDAEEDEESESEVAVKIRGRRVASEDEEKGAAAEEDAEEDDEEEVDEYEEDEEEFEDEDAELEDEEDEAEEEAEPEKPSMGKRIKAALRIKAPQKSEREEVLESLEAAHNRDLLADYELPSLDLLLEPEKMQFDAHEKDVRRKARILEKTFRDFGFNVRVVEVETGPVIAQYEIELEAGLRLSKITGLADDLAIALRVPSVRIVAPIPGKNTVGIEVPNSERQLVRLREVMEEDASRSRKMKIPIFLGKDVSGAPLSVDLASLPHLLIAGRTGTGKSVCLNSIITSIIMTRRPDEVRMLMIDPKMVELGPYKKLPHLMHPVVTDMRKAEAILGWAVEKMEERYTLLAQAGVRHVSVYNQLGEEELQERMAPESEEAWENTPRHLPYIVIIADEMADLMMTAAKEVEQHIIRLAQKSRAVGIHLVLATQKPTVDVITGLIKSNLPARIAFQVASRTDSRVVLDEMGADKLLGSGDMLFLWPGTSSLLRAQGTFLTDDEINCVVDAIGTTEQQFVHELVELKPAGAEEESGPAKFKNRDELYESAIEVVVREGRGSVSLLQRALGVGYGRGARLIDFMAEDGIVGPYNGSQAREVLVTPEQWASMNGEEEVTVAPPERRNKIKMAASADVEDGVEDREDVEEEAVETAEWNDTSTGVAGAGEEEEEEEEVDADEHQDDEEAEYEEDEYEDENAEYEEEDADEEDSNEDEDDEYEYEDEEGELEDAELEEDELEDDEEYEYVYEDEEEDELEEGDDEVESEDDSDETPRKARSA